MSVTIEIYPDLAQRDKGEPLAWSGTSEELGIEEPAGFRLADPTGRPPEEVCEWLDAICEAVSDEPSLVIAVVGSQRIAYEVAPSDLTSVERLYRERLRVGF